MSSIPVDEEINAGLWPEELTPSWILVFNDYPTKDIVACLYFDETNESGSVVQAEGFVEALRLPDAYVSWQDNEEYPEKQGRCREIFVSRDFRRKGIGTFLCAWARSYTLNNFDYYFIAPDKMTKEAQYMYQYISDAYGEEYNNPEDFPLNIPYSYWGGHFV